MEVVHFPSWLDSVRPLLQPPVGNKLLYGEGQHKVMVVGGPNVRDDYHVEIGEEIFYQVEGDMVLKVYEKGVAKDVEIKEGEIFILPGRIPHSPQTSAFAHVRPPLMAVCTRILQRKAHTVGLVIERERHASELDILRWYKRDASGNILYQEHFHCTDLGVQLKPVIERYFTTDQFKTGEVPPGTPEPVDPFAVDRATTLHAPFHLRAWVDAHARGAGRTGAILCGPGAAEEHMRAFEYTVEVVTGPSAEWQAAGRAVGAGEMLLYVMDGTAEADITSIADGSVTHRTLGTGSMLLLPGFNTSALCVHWSADCLALVITNAAPRVSVSSE